MPIVLYYTILWPNCDNDDMNMIMMISMNIVAIIAILRIAAMVMMIIVYHLVLPVIMKCSYDRLYCCCLNISITCLIITCEGRTS